MGTATGVVNVGGFTSTIIASLLVGAVLEVTGPGSGTGYRLAFCCAVAVQVLGTTMAVRWWLRVRGLLLGAQSRGEPVPVPVVRRQFDRIPGGRTPPERTPPERHARAGRARLAARASAR